MFETYRTHIAAVQYIIDVLRNRYKMDLGTLHSPFTNSYFVVNSCFQILPLFFCSEVVKAQRNRPVSLQNTDAVISAGGDGTFLEAASLIGCSNSPCSLMNGSSVGLPSTPCVLPSLEQQIWVFGINTDPSRSEGKLLLQSPHGDQNAEDPEADSIVELRSKYRPERQRKETGGTLSLASLTCINHSIEKIVNGTFKPIGRRRIRVTIFDPPSTGYPSQPPGHLLRQDSITTRRGPSKLDGALRSSPTARSSPSVIQSPRDSSVDLDRTALRSDCTLDEWKDLPGGQGRSIEYRAVNDVLVTSKESHMSMYIEMIVDGGRPQRSKNSGVIICTGLIKIYVGYFKILQNSWISE